LGDLSQGLSVSLVYFYFIRIYDLLDRDLFIRIWYFQTIKIRPVKFYNPRRSDIIRPGSRALLRIISVSNIQQYELSSHLCIRYAHRSWVVRNLFNRTHLLRRIFKYSPKFHNSRKIFIFLENLQIFSKISKKKSKIFILCIYFTKIWRFSKLFGK
jgi:hypothetical protein